MRNTIAATDPDALFGGLEAEMEIASQAAMEEVTQGLKQDLRDRTEGAGLGRKLAYTWQGRTYPQTGKSLDPTAYVWTKAPNIIDAFSRGVTITPVNSKFLLLDTANTPRALRGRRNRPERVLDALKAMMGPLVIRPGRNGSRLVYVKAIAARNKRGWRPVTKGRTAQGRSAKLVLMFVMISKATIGKRFDIDEAGERWAAEYEARFVANLASPKAPVGREPGMVYLDSGRAVPRSSFARYSGPMGPASGFTRR